MFEEALAFDADKLPLPLHLPTTPTPAPAAKPVPSSPTNGTIPASPTAHDAANDAPSPVAASIAAPTTVSFDACVHVLQTYSIRLRAPPAPAPSTSIPLSPAKDDGRGLVVRRSPMAAGGGGLAVAVRSLVLEWEHFLRRSRASVPSSLGSTSNHSSTASLSVPLSGSAGSASATS
jgi:hypothetical protein